MCKAEGALGSGAPFKVDCGKCSCPSSSASHDADDKGVCKNCHQRV